MMGEGYNINVKSSPSGEDLVWPVRCLLWVDVARDSLKDTLMLLNAIVPDELRNCRRGNVPKYSGVGCLIKGAYAMLPTLRLFLEEDNHYDATRASLMLAATMACVLSIDSEAVSATMGEGYNINVKSSPSGEDLVWPVRCLLRAGVARDSLKDTLMLLNAIVPDELRN